MNYEYWVGDLKHRYFLIESEEVVGLRAADEI